MLELFYFKSRWGGGVMDNMYLRSGPCCEFYQNMQIDFKAKMNVLHTMGVKTPRLVVMLYKNMVRDVGKDSLRLRAEKLPCPCHEAPDPVKFRQFVGFILQKKKANDNLSGSELEVENLAIEFLGNENLQKEEG